MATSQNGWTASPDKTTIGIVALSVAGVAFPQGVRRGDVHTVLSYVAGRFHGEVEDLVPGWCWGYNYRPIEGSTSLSNHASGTAIDCNAPRHPLGVAGTFTSGQRQAIRRIVDACDGVVRWGGDYSGRKDEMHFEIVRGADAVARLAARIRQPAPPPRPPAYRHPIASLALEGATVPIKRIKHKTHPEVFAIFSSGLVRHIGPAENRMYEVAGVALVETTDNAEYNRLLMYTRALQD